MLMDIPFPYKMSTRYVQLRMRGIYCLLFRGNKKLAISQYWNNIVNASLLICIQIPIQDSAESHSECRKVKEDNWNSHKK